MTFGSPPRPPARRDRRREDVPFGPRRVPGAEPAEVGRRAARRLRTPRGKTGRSGGDQGGVGGRRRGPVPLRARRAAVADVRASAGRPPAHHRAREAPARAVWPSGGRRREKYERRLVVAPLEEARGEFRGDGVAADAADAESSAETASRRTRRRRGEFRGDGVAADAAAATPTPERRASSPLPVGRREARGAARAVARHQERAAVVRARQTNAAGPEQPPRRRRDEAPALVGGRLDRVKIPTVAPPAGRRRGLSTAPARLGPAVQSETGRLGARGLRERRADEGRRRLGEQRPGAPLPERLRGAEGGPAADRARGVVRRAFSGHVAPRRSARGPARRGREAAGAVESARVRARAARGRGGVTAGPK